MRPIDGLGVVLARLGNGPGYKPKTAVEEESNPWSEVSNLERIKAGRLCGFRRHHVGPCGGDVLEAVPYRMCMCARLLPIKGSELRT